MIPFCDPQFLNDLLPYSRSLDSSSSASKWNEGCAFYPTNSPDRISCEQGKALFWKQDWNSQTGCVTCHSPPFFQNTTQKTIQKTPSLLDVGRVSGPFFWNGRAHSLESQPFWPILNSQEMALTRSEIEKNGGIEKMAKSLSLYVNTLRSSPSLFDQMVQKGSCHKVTPILWESVVLALGKLKCQKCHEGPEFRGTRPLASRFVSLPKEAFSRAEVIYVSDTDLHQEAHSGEVQLNTVAPSLRHVSFSKGPFGRFQQFATLKSFLKQHPAPNVLLPEDQVEGLIPFLEIFLAPN